MMYHIVILDKEKLFSSVQTDHEAMKLSVYTFIDFQLKMSRNLKSTNLKYKIGFHDLILILKEKLSIK